MSKKRSKEEQIAGLKSQIEAIDADIKSYNARIKELIKELNDIIVSLRKEKRDLEHKVFLLKNNSQDTFFLLVKHADNEVFLDEIGTRKSDGLTWAETREEFSSLEEAKLKLAAEGREARLIRDECLQASRKYMLGICVFSKERLFEMSDPI